MAKFNEWDTDAIYDAAERWKEYSLRQGDSLLWPGEKVWTQESLDSFRKCFIENPLDTKISFTEKFKQQLANQSPNVIRLAVEVVFLYFLFTRKVLEGTKVVLLKEISSWGGINLNKSNPMLKAMKKGIGSTGTAYNTRRPFEIAFIARVAERIMSMPLPHKQELLTDHVQFRTLLDEISGKAKFQSRHTLLHMLYPDHYERIASDDHKTAITETFSSLLGTDAPEDVDELLYAIRAKLEHIFPGESLDFYRGEIYEYWHAPGTVTTWPNWLTEMPLGQKLELYRNYNRRNVHDVFTPHTKFVPQAGTWGLQEIIRVKAKENDFVFFVTFGLKEPTHPFEESITESGILTWQSEPGQHFGNTVIQQLIEHDHDKNNIHLFLRTTSDRDYTYLGLLAYVTHDSQREKPVWFKWQILDWQIPEGICEEMGLGLKPNKPLSATQPPADKGLMKSTTPPKSSPSSTKKGTNNFTGQHVDFAENERRNETLGLEGEKWVLDYEKKYLLKNGRPDLAQKVIHQSVVKGDGTGYDILSYTLTGEPKYIEVKTTAGGKGTPFYMSAREMEFSKQHSDYFHLYRVYEFNQKQESGQFYAVSGNVTHEFDLTPIQFRVKR